MSSSVSNKAKSGGGSSESGGSESGSDERGGAADYFGWVFHLGINSIGHEFCHLRFLFIRGKYAEMYKRDPHENPGIKPIRRGVVGHTLMVEELGRRKVNHGDVYVLRFYNRLEETMKGEIACASAGEARKWMEAFDHAKQQAEYELSRGASARNKLNREDEYALSGSEKCLYQLSRSVWSCLVDGGFIRIERTIPLNRLHPHLPPSEGKKEKREGEKRPVNGEGLEWLS